MNSALDDIVDDLADYIAERVVRKLATGTVSDYVDQSSSPLGPRKHIAAIRSGKLRGVKVGRRYLAHRRDVEALVTKTPEPNRESDAHVPQKTDDVDALAAELGISNSDRSGA